MKSLTVLDKSSSMSWRVLRKHNRNQAGIKRKKSGLQNLILAYPIILLLAITVLEMTILVEAETYIPAIEEQTEYHPNYSLEPVDFRIDYQEEKPLVSVPEIDIHVIEGAIITAYCPCSKCCGQWADGITSTGVIATEGVTIAVDPNVIPYGAHVEIFGQEYIAQDTGAAMKRGGCRIDIFMESHSDCLQFGRQTATIQWWEE